MDGFFSLSQLAVTRAPLPLLPKCGACGLLKTCLSPKMPPSGKGSQRILIVGEAPSKHDDEQNRQFTDASGQKLRSTLRRYGIDPDRDCWFTNALICRPPASRFPTNLEVEYCRPNIIKTIEELQPEVIIPLGDSAVESIIPYIWKDDVDGIARWAGWRIPSQKLNAWVCPSYHPLFLSRSNDPVLDRLFDRHIEAAVSLPGRPWPAGPPKFAEQVDVVLDVREAAEVIRNIIECGNPIAFDYETDRLKPDAQDARIVCCSIHANNGPTIAFPWHGEAITAMSELLQAPNEKYGYNIKFEERWTRAEFGHGVTNWVNDGMLTAHILDNRSGITGLKFQAFVRYGMPSWDEHIAPYLEGEGGNGKNQIDKVDISELLLYCGIDSILEYNVDALLLKELQRVSVH